MSLPFDFKLLGFGLIEPQSGAGQGKGLQKAVLEG